MTIASSGQFEADIYDHHGPNRNALAPLLVFLYLIMSIYYRSIGWPVKHIIR